MEADEGEVKRHTGEQYEISSIHVLNSVGMCAIIIETDELQSE
jgi:hypothetical protein